MGHKSLGVDEGKRRIFKRHRGHINLGLSHDITEFAWDILRWYWNRIGSQCRPDADSPLLLVDCGGSNSATKYLFQHGLHGSDNTIGIDIRSTVQFHELLPEWNDTLSPQIGQQLIEQP